MIDAVLSTLIFIVCVMALVVVLSVLLDWVSKDD